MDTERFTKINVVAGMVPSNIMEGEIRRINVAKVTNNEESVTSDQAENITT